MSDDVERVFTMTTPYYEFSFKKSIFSIFEIFNMNFGNTILTHASGSLDFGFAFVRTL